MKRLSDLLPPRAPITSGIPAAGKVALLGGVAAVAGSFMSWASIMPVFGSVEMSGFRGDSKLTAAAAVLAILFGYVAMTRGTHSNATFASSIAIGGLAIASCDWINLQSVAAEASADGMDARVGYGLYLCLGGFVVFVIGMWSAMNASFPVAVPSRTR
jgi:hypothetical protein